MVNGYSERWLRQGFPWVYPAEVTGGRGAPGEVVRIRAPGGASLGVGIADDGWIAVRRLRSDDGPVDRALLAARVDAALALRRVVVPAATTAWRLLHGENDGLPGIRVDVWGAPPPRADVQGRPIGEGGPAPHLAITLDSPSLAVLLVDLLPVLAERLAPASVHLGWRPDPREPRERVWPERLLGRVVPRPGCIAGTPPAAPLVVVEAGARFLVEPGAVVGRAGGDQVASRDGGLFADMRDNRGWLAPYWAGTEVLNLYAYTGAVSVAAARGGASRVVSVDLSAAYLARIGENLALNGLDPQVLVEDDVFRALDRLRRTGERFDRVILDPPGHSHSEGGAFSVEQDYVRLVAAALRVVRPGGWLIAASNLGSLSPKAHTGALIDGARKVGVSLRVIHEGTQAPDFPAALDFPEARYLKFLVVEVAPT